MGLDVNLYAEADPTPEDLARAEEFFTARSELGDPWGDDKRVLVASMEDWFQYPRVEVQTLDRYYGEGYERGNWPRIYGGIRVLQAAFPGCRVFYGSDSTDDGQECTDEMLARVWEHFLGPRGDDYRKPSTSEGEGA
jgi:hypothetical protein